VLRRWQRRLLVSGSVFVAVVLIIAGLGYGYVRYRVDQIKTGSSAALSPSDGSSPGTTDSLQPENILLIGNETRAGQKDVSFGNPSGLTGSLSDVIMILHLDPKTDSASILSIPRDVFAPMPAGSPVGTNQKIDAALNDGTLGPNNLVAAITQDFGIPINHYVEVDFDGFIQTVNALGGIKMDFPERLYDAYSGLHIAHTGCQLLDGQEALALVRSRHLQYDPPGVSPADMAAWPYDPESDLARIVRDHTFVRVLASTAESEGITNPLKANAFLSAFIDQITMDPGLKAQLIQLIVHYRGLNADAAAETTIPVTQVTGPNGDGYYYEGYDIGDVEFPDQPADSETIEKWDPGALPTPVEPKAVRIYNIAGTYRLAADTGSALIADGFNVTLETNGTVPASQSETIVQYHPGQLADGIAVFEKLSGAVILQSVASVPSGTVDVQAGSTFAVDHATKAGKNSSTTVPTPGGQTPSPSQDQLTPYDPRPC
jgi:LCP family protein required for cell wall assembly